jgi:uncharacterized membrane protein
MSAEPGRLFPTPPEGTSGLGIPTDQPPAEPVTPPQGIPMEGFPADRAADYLSTPPLAAPPSTAAPPAVPAQAPAAELAPDTLTWTLPADRPPPVRPARAPWWSFPRARRYLTRFGQAGLTGALIFYCLSLTPSLLPRVWYLQAAMSGVTVIIGYAVGLFIGWLLRSLIPNPLEYMYDGDTAVAAIQYSYLPSWISFLVDKAPAQEAGRDLFDDVYAKWRQLPPGHRPLLVVFGESLGSFGGEAAFSGTDDIVDRTSGVLWVGPTNSNTLWSRFTAGRDPGTPQWLPVYAGGHTVRFGSTPAELAADTAGWHAPRVVYLQNASDPILWWSWQLAFHQPDWLRAPRAPEVSSVMRWYPLVTFWQVSADLALATAVPAGHGHTYGMLQGTAAWASIIPPSGWTQARTVALGELPAN